MPTIAIRYLLINHKKEAIGLAFKVLIESAADIEDLIKIVAGERKNDLEGVDAPRLTLWKLRKPRSAREIENTGFLNKVQLKLQASEITNEDESALKLYPDEGVGDDWEKTGVHVLVQRPAPSSNITGPPNTMATSLHLPESGSEGETQKPPRKRQKVKKRHRSRRSDEYAYPDEAPGSRYAKLHGTDDNTKNMLSFYRSFWGNSLPEEHIKLAPRDSDTIVENGLEMDPDDLLPEHSQPFIRSDWHNLLIRAEYLRIYTFVENNFDEKKPRAVVVTGQPGIGKTWWRFYVLRRRLGNKEPVILHEAQESYLFCSEGVLVIPREDGLRFNSKIWMLIDSKGAGEGIPAAVFNDLSNVFPIYVSSPKPSRWATIGQNWTKYKVLMNPWTKGEMKYAATNLHKEMHLLEVLRRYDNLGPTARMCLEYEKEQVEDHEDEVDNKIKGFIKFDQMETFYNQLISSAKSLDMDPGSHKICLVRRLPNIVNGRDFVVSAMSEIVTRKLACQLQLLSGAEVVRLWRVFSKYGDARGMTGSIWEAYVHGRFREGIEITAYQMWRHGRADSQWHAIFNTTPGDKTPDEEGNKAPVTLHIQDPGHAVYAYGENVNIVADTYYQPSYGQAPGLDSFIVHEGTLYIFQCTGGSKHGVSEKMVEFFAGCEGVSKRVHDWIYIFAIPGDITSFSSPYPRDKPVLHSLRVYTAQVQFD